MALIICPECGKEYSDRAVCCPGCACPTRMPQKPNDSQQHRVALANHNALADNAGVKSYSKYHIRKKKLLFALIPSILVLIIVIVLVVVVIKSNKQNKEIDTKKAEIKVQYEKAVHLQMIGSFSEARELFSQIADYEDSNARETYCEAQILCEKGNYSSAYELLKSIPDYEETRKLLVNIYYETRFFEAIVDLRSIMKNPESLQLNSVKVFYAGTSGLSYTLETPVFISSTSGQNGFGGYATNYECLYQSKGESTYRVVATCRSLDEDEYDTSDDDELIEWAGCVLMRGIMRNCEEIQGAMDFNRINRIISSKNYLTIKRIEDLDFKAIADGLMLPVDNIGA